MWVVFAFTPKWVPAWSQKLRVAAENGTIPSDFILIQMSVPSPAIPCGFEHLAIPCQMTLRGRAQGSEWGEWTAHFPEQHLMCKYGLKRHGTPEPVLLKQTRASRKKPQKHQTTNKKNKNQNQNPKSNQQRKSSPKKLNKTNKKGFLFQLFQVYKSMMS